MTFFKKIAYVMSIANFYSNKFNDLFPFTQHLLVYLS